MNKEQLINLLTTNAKHGNYQQIPPILLDKIPELKKLQKNSIRLDEQRYEWFSEKLDFKNKNVLDIGANTGYFSIRLSTEKDAQVIAYEPFEKHYKAIVEIKNFLSLPDNKLKVEKKGIAINDIEKLPNVDIILFFNVIQHAGEDFDSDKVKNINQWYNYAVEYLQKLAQKANYIVFQMGYSWLGHNGVFCPENQIIEFTLKLFKDAKLQIKHFAVIKNPLLPKYIDITPENHLKHPILKFPKKYTLEIFKKLKLTHNNYRFMQRPILIFSK